MTTWLLLMWVWDCNWTTCQHAGQIEVVYQTETQCEAQLARWKDAGQSHGGVCIEQPQGEDSPVTEGRDGN